MIVRAPGGRSDLEPYLLSRVERRSSIKPSFLVIDEFDAPHAADIGDDGFAS